METPTPQDFYKLQEQFTQMQVMLLQLHNSSQLSNQAAWPNFDIVQLFLKSTTAFHNQNDPQKTKLLFDGSNFQRWPRDINRMLSYVFNTKVKYTNNKANFVTRGKREKEAIAVLLQGTTNELL